MKKIAVITTGGTIAMTSDPILGVIPSDKVNRKLNEIPEINEIAETELIEFSNIPSPHITPDKMLELSNLVKKIIKSEDFDGVVITHGTDTLEETAYFLDLMIDNNKPVVMTAAMRDWNEPSTDGPRNLIASIRVATKPAAIEEGVLVCLNDEIHAAREVTKTYTSNVATFDSPGYGPLGIVDNEIVIFYRRSLLRMHINSDKIENRVALIKTYTGDQGEIIRELPKLGYKGLVIEAFGRGNVPERVADALEEVIKKGLPVVLVSRCYKGRVLGVYGYKGGGADLKDRGVILGQEISGPKARVKLMVVLGKTNKINIIKSYFESK